MTTIRASQRSVRAPLRFSEQSEYLPSKFGGSNGANNSNNVDEPCDMSQIPITTEQNTVSFDTAVNELEVTLVDSWGDEPEVDSWGDEPEVDSQGNEPQVDSWGNEPQVDSWGDEPEVDFSELDASNTLMEMSGHQETNEQVSERKRAHANLDKYGKHCAQTRVFTLGCEQDPSNGKWYSQSAWKDWMDEVDNCPEGVIEYHRIGVSNDSYGYECTDDVVHARMIYGISDVIYEERENIYYGESHERLKNKSGEYDEYAIINQSYFKETGGFECHPMFLITSTGVLYSIEGNTYKDDIDYNPIVNEVVSFLKTRLLNQGYGYGYDDC